MERRGEETGNLIYCLPPAPTQPSPTPPPPTSSHLLNRQRGMCKVRRMAEPRGSDCECARLYLLESNHFLSVPLLPSRIFCFYLPSPPSSSSRRSQHLVWTINLCVLESLLSYLSFKILQLSILLLWQRLLIIRSEIRLPRALCPASISHARGTMLASIPRRVGLTVFMLLVKIGRQPFARLLD